MARNRWASFALCLSAVGALAASDGLVIANFEFRPEKESQIPQPNCGILKLRRAGDDVALDGIAMFRGFELRARDGSYQAMTVDAIDFMPPPPPPPKPRLGQETAQRTPSLRATPARSPGTQHVFKVAGSEIGQFAEAVNLVPEPSDTKNLAKRKEIGQLPFKHGDSISSFDLRCTY